LALFVFWVFWGVGFLGSGVGVGVFCCVLC
jgi:hypothetical protein